MTRHNEGAGREVACFDKAMPVWPAGRDTDMNLTVAFRATFSLRASDRAGTVLRVAAAATYRAWLNGRFLGHGPARGPLGFARVDVWPLHELARGGDNLLAIEVASYNAVSYCQVDTPAFCQAEIADDCGRILAATADPEHDWTAFVSDQRVQRVQRFSFQRPFSEVYRLPANRADWWRTPALSPDHDPTPCAIVPARGLLPRGVPLPRFECTQPVRLLSSGTLRTNVEPASYIRDRSLTGAGPGQRLNGFAEPQIEQLPSLEVQRMPVDTCHSVDAWYDPVLPLPLDHATFHVLDLGVNRTGFIGLHVECTAPTRLFVGWDELLGDDGDVNLHRMDCVNVILWELQPGHYDLESFEPYTLRYLRVFTATGQARVTGVFLRNLAAPDVWEAHFSASDNRLNRLFEAARETYRQNAVDIFMDCPSRERAGWLCDSFFTAQVAPWLSGNTAIERNFLENFACATSFPGLDEGVLPMCYPGDHPDGITIPAWTLWFIVQLEDYLKRGGDPALVESLRSRVQAQLEYFQAFRNEAGLLEGLKGWLFLEWSENQRFQLDVNFPTNMLFAAALDVAGRLYRRPDLCDEGLHLRAVIRERAFDGQFFLDNALRQGGRLLPTGNKSELAQYFAFFFGVATPQRDPELWNRLVTDFGPQRRQTGLHPDVHFAAPFVGNAVRLEVLARYGKHQEVLDESAGYYQYMADATGTLWEMADRKASCNHGFASYLAVLYFRCALGVDRIDPVNRQVRLVQPDVALDWCEGRIPLGGGALLQVRWWREGQEIKRALRVPAGYRVLWGE